MRKWSIGEKYDYNTVGTHYSHCRFIGVGNSLNLVHITRIVARTLTTTYYINVYKVYRVYKIMFFFTVYPPDPRPKAKHIRVQKNGHAAVVITVRGRTATVLQGCIYILPEEKWCDALSAE